VIAVARVATELGLLAAAVVGGWRLSDGWPGILVALVLLVVVAAVWGRWIAPRAGHRLPDPGRLAAEGALFAAAGLLLAVSGLSGWGVVLAVGGVTVALLVRRSPLPT
jgi:hypothetical protein